MLDFSEIRKIDGAVADAIVAELERQQHNIELIASENIVSKAVMYTMGTPLTNKYAEGYPAKRYYGGCEKVDIVENLAKERAKEQLRQEQSIREYHMSKASLARAMSRLRYSSKDDMRI